MQTSQFPAPRKPDASGAGKAKLPFAFVTVLIDMAGIGIIAPVSPFIAERPKPVAVPAVK